MKIDHAVYFVQFLIAVLAIWATWKFIRAFVLFRVENLSLQNALMIHLRLSGRP